MHSWKAGPHEVMAVENLLFKKSQIYAILVFALAMNLNEILIKTLAQSIPKEIHRAVNEREGHKPELLSSARNFCALSFRLHDSISVWQDNSYYLLDSSSYVKKDGSGV